MLISLYDSIDETAIAEKYMAVFGLNLCTSCPSEVRKAIIQLNKMAKAAEKNKPTKRFKAEYQDLQVSVRHYLITSLNLNEELIKVLENSGLGHYLEPNE